MENKMIRTLFDISVALIQAPMAGVQDANLAASVCEAGGLGSLPCAMLSNQQLIEQLELLSRSTSKPYNLNFFCHSTLQYTKLQKQQWHSLLAPYFNEYAIAESSLTDEASRQPINQSVIDIIAPYKPAVVSFHFGLPAPSLLGQIKSWGTKVISTATTVEEAKWLADNGADAVIAQGLEAGGHRGHFLSMDLSLHKSTAELVQECVAHVSVPIIAAGGIATEDDVAHMQTLGASGVQVGSAYLLCNEATTSKLHRDAILAQQKDSTALTTLFSGRAARGVCNRVMQELGAIPAHVPPFPYASIAITALRSRVELLGGSGFSPLWCGQKYIPRENISAAQITQILMQKWSV